MADHRAWSAVAGAFGGIGDLWDRFTNLSMTIPYRHRSVPPEEANEALIGMKKSQFNGDAVLVP